MNERTDRLTFFFFFFPLQKQSKIFEIFNFKIALGIFLFFILVRETVLKIIRIHIFEFISYIPKKNPTVASDLNQHQFFRTIFFLFTLIFVGTTFCFWFFLFFITVPYNINLINL